MGCKSVGQLEREMVVANPRGMSWNKPKTQNGSSRISLVRERAETRGPRVGSAIPSRSFQFRGSDLS